MGCGSAGRSARRGDAPGLPDQAVGLHAALAAYTREGAWVEPAEPRKGILRPGHLANLVLPSGDIEAVPPLTICHGPITHEA